MQEDSEIPSPGDSNEIDFIEIYSETGSKDDYEIEEIDYFAKFMLSN